MKKFLFAAICCLSLAAAFTSCKKDSKEPEPVVTGLFTIKTDSVTATSAKVIITPKAEVGAYYFDIVPAANYNAATIAQDIKEYLDQMIAQYSQYIEITYADFASEGPDSYMFPSLYPNTEYVIVAYGLNIETGLPDTDIETARFKTPDVQVIGEKTLDFDVNTSYNDQTTDQGWWQFMGETDVVNNQYYVFSASNYDEVSEAAGTYDWSVMDPDYTYLIYYTINGTDTTYQYIDFLSGQFEVVTAGNSATLNAVAVGNDNIRYTIHIEAAQNALPARRVALKPAEVKIAKKVLR